MEERIRIPTEAEYGDAYEDFWGGLAECVKALHIWRYHTFVNGVCEHCGMRLQ